MSSAGRVDHEQIVTKKARSHKQAQSLALNSFPTLLRMKWEKREYPNMPPVADRSQLKKKGCSVLAARDRGFRACRPPRAPRFQGAYLPLPASLKGSVKILAGPSVRPHL